MIFALSVPSEASKSPLCSLFPSYGTILLRMDGRQGNMEAEKYLGQLKARFKITNIFYFSQIGIILLLFGLLYWMQTPNSSPSAPSQNFLILKGIFFGISLLVVFLMSKLKKKLLGDPNQVPLQAHHKNPFEAKLGKLVSTQFIVLSLAEMVGIFGFILTFISQDMNDFYPFLVLSLGLFLLHYPRYLQWAQYCLVKHLKPKTPPPGA
jgi:hypothetical protein